MAYPDRIPTPLPPSLTGEYLPSLDRFLAASLHLRKMGISYMTLRQHYPDVSDYFPNGSPQPGHVMYDRSRIPALPYTQELFRSVTFFPAPYHPYLFMLNRQVSEKVLSLTRENKETPFRRIWATAHEGGVDLSLITGSDVHIDNEVHMTISQEGATTFVMSPALTMQTDGHLVLSRDNHKEVVDTRSRQIQMDILRDTWSTTMHDLALPADRLMRALLLSPHEEGTDLPRIIAQGSTN